MFIKVKVSAGSKRESIKQKNSDTFEIAVKEEAERNMANSRVIELLASHFNVDRSKIWFVSGRQKPSKIFNVHLD